MNIQEEFSASAKRPQAHAPHKPLGRASLFFVNAFERYMPDSFVVATLLTALTLALAFCFAPHHRASDVLSAWYKGLFDIAAFAFMVALMLVSGYALSVSPPISFLLSRLACLPKTPASAVTLTIWTTAFASMLHWAFGLVVAGLLAREVGKRLRVDFAWLVAAAYSGWGLFTLGLSSSAQLISATHGASLNVVEKVSGYVLPLSATIFSRLSVVPMLMLLVILPAVFCALKPADGDIVTAELTIPKEPHKSLADSARQRTFAERLSHAWWTNMMLVIVCGAYFVVNGISFDFVSVIVLFLIGGMLLHWMPDAYIKAINEAAKLTGPILLQFPLYGGIMGIMMSTGLADTAANWIVTTSTPSLLPFSSFLSSVVISVFIPSAGGHWAVQGPFIIRAAQTLHASLAATVVGVAAGEGTADMIQPMWVLPVMAIAGVGMRRVMGFAIISFFTMLIVFGTALLMLTPA